MKHQRLVFNNSWTLLRYSCYVFLACHRGHRPETSVTQMPSAGAVAVVVFQELKQMLEL